MKKQILAVMLTGTMVFGCSLSAFAAEAESVPAEAPAAEEAGSLEDVLSAIVGEGGGSVEDLVKSIVGENGENVDGVISPDGGYDVEKVMTAFGNIEEKDGTVVINGTEIPQEELTAAVEDTMNEIEQLVESEVDAQAEAVAQSDAA